MIICAYVLYCKTARSFIILDSGSQIRPTPSREQTADSRQQSSGASIYDQSNDHITTSTIHKLYAPLIATGYPQIAWIKRRLQHIIHSLQPSTSFASKYPLYSRPTLIICRRMSGLRSRRVVDRDAEPTDLFSSSMIFGNASTGVSSDSSHPNESLIDGEVIRMQHSRWLSWEAWSGDSRSLNCCIKNVVMSFDPYQRTENLLPFINVPNRPILLLLSFGNVISLLIFFLTYRYRSQQRSNSLSLLLLFLPVLPTF